MKDGRSVNVNCIQAVLTIPIQYSDYVLRLHDGSQWEYTKAARVDPNGLLRWGQTKELLLKSNTLNVQLVGSDEASLQIVYTILREYE